MTRWTSSTNEAAAALPTVVMVCLVDLDFAGGHVRVHDGAGSLTHATNEYLGVGTFGGIEMDGEDAEVAARGVRLTLSGIPSDLVPNVLAETGYQGRAATIYIGLLNQDSRAWIDTPETVWSGQLDFMDLSYDEDGSARVVLHVEDELRREPLQSWYTDQDQQLRYAGDTFFAGLDQIPYTRASWGLTTVYGSGGGRAGGRVGSGGGRVVED